MNVSFFTRRAASVGDVKGRGGRSSYDFAGLRGAGPRRLRSGPPCLLTNAVVAIDRAAVVVDCRRDFELVAQGRLARVVVWRV